jgi:predicted Fe-S protein YdhL (DUF1289 family)
MRPNIQRSSLRQLALFSENIEVPRWHELNESTRKDVVRHLAQLIGHSQETSVRQLKPDSGAHDE